MRHSISFLIVAFLILYANLAEAFLGALISGAAAVAKMAAKHAIKAATDAAKNAVKNALKKKRDEEREKKRQQELNRKRREKENKAAKRKKERTREELPDEPSDLDDFDLELMEGIVEYKSKHAISPYSDGDAFFPQLNRMSQKDVRHLSRIPANKN